MATLNPSVGEETPLLPAPPQISIVSSSSRWSRWISDRTYASSCIRRARSPHVITAIVLASLLWLQFGGYLMAVPVLRVYEDIICHHYYDRLQGAGYTALLGNIDESMCKKDDIQNELSIVVAGSHFLGAITGLLATIPYGMLMDRIGRKPIFMLAMVGVVLEALWGLVVMWFWRTLPLRFVWLSPVFTLIGGGTSVGSMAFFAIISDITPEAKRTDVFFLAAATDLVAQLIGPSMAAILMAKSPWIPLTLGFFAIIFGSLLVIFIPETLHINQISDLSHLASPSNNDFPNSPKSQKSLLPTIKHQISASLQSLKSSISILNSAPLILLLATFVIKHFSGQSVDISLRYISNRFQFPLRYSSFLWSLRAGVQIVLFLLVLPTLSRIMTTRLQMPPAKKDLYLARASILILTLGSILIAASPTLPLAILGMAVFTLGAGYMSITRSLITTLVDQRHKGQLYAAVAVVETTGRLIAGPAFAQLYILGLRLKGAWVGLPFFGLGVICGLSAIAVWSAGWVMSRRNYDWENGSSESVGNSANEGEDVLDEEGEVRQ